MVCGGAVGLSYNELKWYWGELQLSELVVRWSGMGRAVKQ